MREQDVHFPSKKQVAKALAKYCNLPYSGKTSGGRAVHTPSDEQVELWVQRVLRDGYKSRGAKQPSNLLTDKEIASVFIAKMKLRIRPDGASVPAPRTTTTEQIVKWLEFHS
jgi:hypothetical protein